MKENPVQHGAALYRPILRPGGFVVGDFEPPECCVAFVTSSLLAILAVGAGARTVQRIR